jgi:geranylgeranyl diphosphate synthase type II
MYSISNLQQLITKAIAQQKYPVNPSELYEPISYLMNLGGKRLRPALLLMATDLFKGDVEKAIKPALAIEVFHNFTLMHDDIMDKAPLRRGNPTVHAKWNEAVAILSGDVMLVEAYKLIMQVKPAILPDILKIFNDTAVGVCEGQQIDMNFENYQEVKVDEYINMIRLKTAVLLGGALKIGALIGEAAENDAQLLYDFGEKLGIAFQLQDDILDVYGDPEKFGKQVGGDIISNKKTFLLIRALELAQGAQKEELQNWLSKTTFNAQEKVAAVTAIYNSLNIQDIAKKEMENYAAKGLASLDKIAVDEERKSVLKEFADMLMLRDN